MVGYHHNKKKPVLETAGAVVPELTVRCAGFSDNRHAWQSRVIEQVVSGGALPAGLDCTTVANILRCALTSHAIYPIFVGDLSRGPARKGAWLTEQHPTSLSRTPLGGRQPASVVLSQCSFGERGGLMSTRSLAILSALSGIAGPIMLGLSFVINNSSPPDNATAVQVTAFGQEHLASIMWGAWLQAVSPVLIVLFALAIVFLAGAMTRLAGWMTMFGAGVLMTVSLIEVTFYIGTLENGLGLISLGLIHAVQHLYFIVAAPALFLPLGIVILGSRVLPRVLGYLALALGVGFAALGVGFLYALTLPALVTDAAFVSALWFWAAAITLLVRTLRGPSMSTEFHA